MTGGGRCLGAALAQAAGAEELWFGTTPRVWRRGEDLEAWVDELDQVHIGANGLFMGSAHQMGSARMGTDPATSVARPTGESNGPLPDPPRWSSLEPTAAMRAPVSSARS